MSPATRPTYLVVLAEHPDGDWSIEPIGLTQIPGYDPLRVGPMGCYVKSPDLGDLLCEQAPTVIAAALDADRYSFDLQFIALHGRLLATLTQDTPPPAGDRVFHMELRLRPELRSIVEAR